MTRRREAESGMRWLLKRWWFWTGAGFMLVAIVTGYFLIPIGVEESEISQATCDKIKLGWSDTQVTELLNKRGVVASAVAAETGFVAEWTDELGDRIVVTFERGDGRKVFLGFFWGPGDFKVIGKNFIPIPLTERMKRRIERRVRALWS